MFRMFRGKSLRKRQICERQIETLTGISLESVRRRVREEAAGTENRREIPVRYSRSRLRRCICVAAAVALLACLSAMTFAGILDFRTLLWGGETEKVRDSGCLPSLENGDIRFTVEDAVSDDTMMYLVYSLESLSEKGTQIIENNPVWIVMDNMEISFSDTSGGKEGTHRYTGVLCSPLKELNRGVKKYFRAEIPLNGVEKISFRMEEGGETADLPMSLNPENVRFELFSDEEAEDWAAGKGREIPAESGLTGEGWILKEIMVTKLSFRVTCFVRNESAGRELPWIEIVYDDGSSLPLADIAAGGYSADSGEPEWKESGEFHRESEFGTFSEVQNPEEIKAVRIAGKEYFTVG